MPEMKMIAFQTHTGRTLTAKENTFINKYLELGNASQAVRDAGYQSKAPEQYGNALLRKSYIAEEIRYRLSQMQADTIAKADEVMQYFTAVMRGEVKDQFGLETPVSERTKAAVELARRTVDIDNRLAGKEDATINIKLDWGDDIK